MPEAKDLARDVEARNDEATADLTGGPETAAAPATSAVGVAAAADVTGPADVSSAPDPGIVGSSGTAS